MKLLTAEEAARALGVQKATLYAYVSRGMLTSVEGADRQSRYRWEDIERLRLRKVGPRQAAGEALYGGLPSLSSQISSIEGGRLYYRQKPLEDFLERPDLAQLAAWLWTGQPDFPLGKLDDPGEDEQGWSGPFLPGAWQWLAHQWEADPRGWNRCSDGFCASGWRIFKTFFRRLSPHPRLHEALVATADHELNPSAMTARIAASTGANPYAVVSAALGTFSGFRHGGACQAVETLVLQSHSLGPREALLRHLKRGGDTLGFGHFLYPQGDPRARWLLAGHPQGAAWEEAGMELLGLYPSLDLALVVLGFEDPMAVFATGRTLGWVAHALEQWQDGRIIRPRARI